MGTAFLYTIRESIYRRMGVALLVSSLLLTGVYLYNHSFERRAADGLVIVHSIQGLVPAPVFVKNNYDGLLALLGGPWLFLGIFAAAPLLSSYLDKGWAELLLSKGVPRWQMLLARYFGALAIYALSMLIVAGLPALYVWWGTGLGPARLFAGMGLILVGFATTLALMSMLAVHQPNPALLIMAGFLQILISSLLAARNFGLLQFVKSEWGKWVLEWMYRIVPKNQELGRIGTSILWERNIESWFPLWTTAIFLVVCVALACWFLHRKSF